MWDFMAIILHLTNEDDMSQNNAIKVSGKDGIT